MLQGLAQKICGKSRSIQEELGRYDSLNTDTQLTVV